MPDDLRDRGPTASRSWLLSYYAAPMHTYLFTDIAGSTRLWEEHPTAMAEALARHDSILLGRRPGRSHI